MAKEYLRSEKMPTPNEQRDRLIGILNNNLRDLAYTDFFSSNGAVDDLLDLWEEIIASERQAAADRVRARYPDVPWINLACAAILNGQSARPKELRYWTDGEPPFPWNTEWFFAKLKNGTYAVLHRLPEEYSYDYKTVDETYYKKDWIVAWMQIPDSEFISAAPLQEALDRGKRLIERQYEELAALSRVWPDNIEPTGHMLDRHSRERAELAAEKAPDE
jgi:hypothetical protein